MVVSRVNLGLTSAVQRVQVNCCARLVQRTPDSQKGACCAAPTSPGISGDAHSPGGKQHNSRYRPSPPDAIDARRALVTSSTDQGEQEAADGACSLTEGAVLLQEHGDELVGLRRALHRGHGRRRAHHFGPCGQVLEQAHPHFQDVLARLLLQPLVQLERVLLTEPAGGKGHKCKGCSLETLV